MSGNCYAVVFKNNVCKIGRSKNVIKRVLEHVKSGEIMGIKPALILITENVEDEIALEKRLLAKFNNEENTRGVEYFENISTQMAVDAFSNLGIIFYPVKEIKRVVNGGISCVMPAEFIFGTNMAAEYNDIELSGMKSKILTILAGTSATTGIIANRMRTKSKAKVSLALSQLEDELRITRTKHMHVKKPLEISTWSLTQN